MIPTTGHNFKKKLKKVRVTCPGWFNMELPDEAFFLLAIVAMITVKSLLVFLAAVVKETYSFIKSCNLLVQNIIKKVESNR